MTVGDPVDNLLEDWLRLSLSQTALLLHQLKQVASRSILEHHIHVLIALKDFEESDDVLVPDR